LIRRVSRRIYLRGYLWAQVLISFLIFLPAVTRDKEPLVALFGVIGFIAILMWQSYAEKVNRWIGLFEEVGNRSLTFEFDENSVRVTSALGVAHFKWGDFHQLVTLKDFWLLRSYHVGYYYVLPTDRLDADAGNLILQKLTESRVAIKRKEVALGSGRSL
jgi:hypothetical protein